MKKVIADNRISEKCERALFALGYTPIKLPAFSALPAPVASHPDMLLFLHGDMLICHESYYKTAKDELDKTGKNIVLTNELIEDKYPHDILFNAAKIGTYLFGKLEYISQKIKELPLKQVNINQGYAKCSTCIVNERALITSDASVEKKAREIGIDVLKISPSHILLPGYDTGFIGGTAGVTDNFVAFCGDISSHPDGQMIKDFCRYHSKEAISLSDEPLYDVGTLFFL